MKTLLTILAFTSGLAVMAPVTAQAGHGSSYASASYSRCGNCGAGISRQRVIVGYDRCGEPIYNWRSSYHHCAPRHGHGGGHGSGHGHGHGHNRGHQHGH